MNQLNLKTIANRLDFFVGKIQQYLHAIWQKHALMSNLLLKLKKKTKTKTDINKNEKVNRLQFGWPIV